MKEYIVEKKQTSGGWTWAEPKGELIRCKDCKYWRANTQFCAMFSGVCTAHRMPPNGYCSEAERKEL